MILHRRASIKPPDVVRLRTSGVSIFECLAREVVLNSARTSTLWSAAAWRRFSQWHPVNDHHRLSK
jgi:hypothetical protein